MLNLKTQSMGAKSKKVLKVVSGWDAVELILQCLFYGLYQLLKIAFRRLWKGHRRRPSKNFPPVELTVDSSVGTHCYIKIMGVKYHYVEAGPKNGDIILVLGDAPDPGLIHIPGWSQVVRRLTDSGHRVVALDLRGSGGSEAGSRADLSPPRVVEELHVMLQALGASEHRPAVVIGHGIGGMLAWYLVHSHGSSVSKFVVVDAPHPSLYWQFPPAAFCAGTLHFAQWPYLPERWLAASQSGDESQRWANSRAADWSGALNYVRGAAWWQISADRRAEPRALLVARGSQAAQLVASAERCLAPVLRLVREESEIAGVLVDFLIEKEPGAVEADSERRSTLVGRVFGAVGAVAGRGRELSARLLPPAPA